MRRYGKSIAKTCTWDDLRGGKLLMVLDDIDKPNHVDIILEIAKEHALPGSRYIATSRDMGLLKWLGHEPQYGKTHICKIPFLRDEDAKRLFYSYAFPNGENPPETLGGIVEEIVRVCEGLPLTLKVLGAHLGDDRDESRWAEIPSAMKTAHSISDFEERIWAVLRVSYEALKDYEQDLFLEMACTLTRDDHWFPYDEMKWVLASKYESYNNLLKALEEKCLIKNIYVRPLAYDNWYSSEDIFRMYHPFHMHEHLRNMGYKIAKDRGRSMKRLIYRLGEEYQSVLHEEIASLAVIRGNGIRPEQLALMQSIADMTGLRYLDLYLVLPEAMYLGAQNALLGAEEEGDEGPQGAEEEGGEGSQGDEEDEGSQGDEEGEEEEEKQTVDPRIQERFPNGILSLPASVTMARFWGYSWEFNFKSATIRFENLVVLDLIIQDVWPSDYLSATVCERLPALTCLRLSWRKPIKSCAIAFEKLRKLEHLRLACASDGANFAELPGSFRYLSSLQYLDLRCTSFPDTVDNWSRLEHLRIEGCPHLVELPCGNLSRLRHLSISTCDSLIQLPETFGKLTNLKHLGIIQCRSLQKLPDSFGNLSRLQSLRMVGLPELEELPESFGELSGLQQLELTQLRLMHLPKSLGDLSGLQQLELTQLQLRYLPDSFRSLSNLKSLSIQACSRLQGFSDMLENFSKLRHLRLIHPPTLAVSSIRFGSFTSLENVILCRCWSAHKEVLREQLVNTRTVLELREDCVVTEDAPGKFAGLTL